MKQNQIRASVITIGDELLIGQTIDTNSAWIAQELNKIGIWVHRRTAIGDVWKDIWKSLEDESKVSNIVLITGGLGPTADDITKPLLCEYFNGKMIVDQGALENVKNIFENILKRPMIERNLKQAEVPDVCNVIPNLRGTAPGMWFNHKNPELQEDRIFISMPGVPHEMKGMMSHYILPKLKQQFNLTPIIHKTLITAGIGESFLAERIQDFESALPDSIKLAYLPNYGMVKLRLTATDNKSETEGELLGLFEDLKHSLTDVLVTDQDQSLQEVVGNLLIKSGKTLSTIESCTGGYVSHLLTSIAGSSVYFHGSIVCYSNEIKKNLIDVPPAILEQHGAVSEETIRFMLEGGLKKMKTDYVLATSGIMGPSGGSADKPLGTVWIGVANKNKMHTKKFHFRFDRSRNIELTATNALNNLRKLILEELETI